MYGYDSKDDIAKSIETPIPNNVRFVSCDVKLIDWENKKVETDTESYRYDWLVSAMSCHVAPEEIDGLQEHMGNGVHSFYTLDGAIQMQKALEGMHSGGS